MPNTNLELLKKQYCPYQGISHLGPIDYFYCNHPNQKDSFENKLKHGYPCQPGIEKCITVFDKKPGQKFCPNEHWNQDLQKWQCGITNASFPSRCDADHVKTCGHIKSAAADINDQGDKPESKTDYQWGFQCKYNYKTITNEFYCSHVTGLLNNNSEFPTKYIHSPCNGICIRCAVYKKEYNITEPTPKPKKCRLIITENGHEFCSDNKNPSISSCLEGCKCEEQKMKKTLSEFRSEPKKENICPYGLLKNGKYYCNHPNGYNKDMGLNIPCGTYTGKTSILECIQRNDQKSSQFCQFEVYDFESKKWQCNHPSEKNITENSIDRCKKVNISCFTPFAAESKTTKIPDDITPIMGIDFDKDGKVHTSIPPNPSWWSNHSVDSNTWKSKDFKDYVSYLHDQALLSSNADFVKGVIDNLDLAKIYKSEQSILCLNCHMLTRKGDHCVNCGVNIKGKIITKKPLKFTLSAPDLKPIPADELEHYHRLDNYGVQNKVQLLTCRNCKSITRKDSNFPDHYECEKFHMNKIAINDVSSMRCNQWMNNNIQECPHCKYWFDSVELDKCPVCGLFQKLPVKLHWYSKPELQWKLLLE